MAKEPQLEPILDLLWEVEEVDAEEITPNMITASCGGCFTCCVGLIGA